MPSAEQLGAYNTSNITCTAADQNIQADSTSQAPSASVETKICGVRPVNR
jgi:hypothetical protein